MNYRSFRRYAFCVSALLPACSSDPGAEQEVDAVERAALTGTDVTPTSLAAVTDLRGIPSGVEGLDKVFDNDTSTKLYLGKKEEWISYQLARPAIVTSYDVTSANDYPERDPKEWTLEGSFDRIGWTVLDVQSNQSFTARFQTKSYTFTNTAPYLYYRLKITDNLGEDNGDLQLAEFRLGGSVPSGTVPASPTLGTVSASGTSVSLAWGTVAGATGYYVQRVADDGLGTIESYTTSTSYVDANLAPGTTYVYQVQATNGTIRGLPSALSTPVTTAAATLPSKDLTALSTYAPTDPYSTVGVEGVAKITDGSPYTKYYTGNATTWIVQQTASSSVVTAYTLTSANDEPDRDPKNWVLEGSSNGVDNWVPLDTRSNQGFVSRFQTRVFPCNTSGVAYGYYRLRITGNHGSGSTQLAEFRLFGTGSGTLAAPAAPSGVQATAVTSNQIRVTWTDNAGQQNPESAYVVEQATNNTFTEDLIRKTVGAGSTEYRASSMLPGKTYYYRVRADNAAGSSAFAGPVSATTAALTDPPASWVETGWYGGHNRTVYRTYLDRNIALYFDEYVTNRNSVTWMSPIFTEAWAYVKRTYGSFSDPILYVIGNQDNIASDVNDAYSVGGIQDVFNSDAYYRNIIFSVSGDWTSGPDWSSTDPGWNFGSLLHEMCHIVEGNNNGTWGSPSYGVWQDSKWAEIFAYDVLLHIPTVTSSSAATNEYNRHLTDVDDYGRHWFRDWYYPLYSGSAGNTAADKRGTALLVRYFQLLAQYLPKANGSYPRGLNMGEYIHFMSGAAGMNLETLGRTAFATTPQVALQLARARAEFPAIYALYDGSNANAAPYFYTFGLVRSGTVNTALSGQTLAGTATDPNSGSSLTFSKESGPAWLAVASDGTLSGTPTTPGTTSAVVRVTDSAGLYGTTELRLEIAGSGAAAPCDSLCSSPVAYTTQSYNSGNLGTAATCHQTTANLQGLVCGNFASGRTFSINGTAVNCSGERDVAGEAKRRLLSPSKCWQLRLGVLR
ncbi:MAG: fibronectin type III domain-containing protein [Polyangiaceae bacterium]